MQYGVLVEPSIFGPIHGPGIIVTKFQLHQMIHSGMKC
jgi:hypothetical protein